MLRAPCLKPYEIHIAMGEHHSILLSRGEHFPFKRRHGPINEELRHPHAKNKRPHD